MQFDTTALSKGENYQLMVQGIVPRPIAWVSTVDKNGVANLAPYSFFTGVSCNPPVLSLSQVTPADTHDKDTLKNLLETDECVVNIVSYALAEKMNKTSAPFSRDIDEFGIADVEPITSHSVKPMGVKHAKVRYECSLREVIRVSDLPSGGSIVLLNILSVFVDDSVYKEHQIDGVILDAVGKLGGNEYATTREKFTLDRP